MKRENRYLVIKLSDIEKYLDHKAKVELCAIDSGINFDRQQDGRGLLNAVVVEHDWPEYEPTWQAIEKRVECIFCKGTGIICIGTSESDEDGNCPQLEPCPSCQDV